MRRYLLVLLLTLSACVIAAPAHRPPPHVRARVDFTVFRQELSPYGTWVLDAELGWVWRPTVVSAGWRPYTTGRWVWEDGWGWTWEADEPWGWAPFHYGRWAYRPAMGWIWIPGYEWAPAWVVWRWDDEFIAWAPAPPAGLFVSGSTSYHVWSFVRHDEFRGGRRVRDVMLPPERARAVHGRVAEARDDTPPPGQGKDRGKDHGKKKGRRK